jgi:hypothetical protein
VTTYQAYVAVPGGWSPIEATQNHRPYRWNGTSWPRGTLWIWDGTVWWLIAGTAPDGRTSGSTVATTSTPGAFTSTFHSNF